MHTITDKEQRTRALLLGLAINKHGGLKGLAAATDLSYETLRLLTINPDRMSYPSANAIDRAMGNTALAQTFEGIERGALLYRTPLGTALLSKANAQGVRPSRILREAGISPAEMSGAAHRRQGFSDQRIARICEALAKVGVTVNDQEHGDDNGN